MRVFVAGASGAIGRPLIPKLVAAGHEVTGMTRKEESAEEASASASASASSSPRSAASCTSLSAWASCSAAVVTSLYPAASSLGTPRLCKRSAMPP